MTKRGHDQICRILGFLTQTKWPDNWQQEVEEALWALYATGWTDGNNDDWGDEDD